MHNFQTKKSIYFFIVTSIFFGFLIGFFTSEIKQKTKNIDNNEFQIIHSKIDSGKLTNPILDCSSPKKTQVAKYRKIEFELSDYIDNKIEKKDGLTTISVYVRNMDSGAWIGVNEKESFAPASLLKVPVMLAYLKQSEKDSLLLNKILLYGSSNINKDIPQNIKPTVNLQKNQSYTVSEFIEAMIIDSDNEAMNSLILNLPEVILDEVYLDLGLQIPGVRTANDFMSVYEYASFFRILYNASYLNIENSEKALEILSKVEFENGIRKPIPKDIIIANKFGERIFENPDGKNLKQLHDCGIIYHPFNPYLLCVMTRGNDLKKQEKVIQDISEITYRNINLPELNK